MGIMLVFIGTYTQKTSRGVYAFRFDSTDGTATEPWLAAEARSPTFLALAPDRKHVYATGELRPAEAGDPPSGGVSAYRIDEKSGRLEFINQRPTGDGGTTHGVVDAMGRTVITVNYHAGYVCALPILPDGSIGDKTAFIEPRGPLGPVKQRQDKPHPHSATLSPDNRFVLVCDLGLDRIHAYRLDPAHAALSLNNPAFGTAPPGSGPRHSKFSRDGRFFYVLNEMGGTICAYTFDPMHGAMALRQTISTLPADFHGANGCAEIRLHPNERFVYASNRGHDSLAVFARDPEAGTLELVEIVPCGGGHPRNFALSPDGRWLLCANRDSNNVVIFKVDAASGRLEATGRVLSIPEPVCVLFLP